MMLKPSIDSLLKEVPSKYSLVILASKRAHELDEGVQPTVESFDSVKSVGRALEEIEAGTVIQILKKNANVYALNVKNANANVNKNKKN